jgi:hypothetical protein
VKRETLYTYCEQVGRREKDYETNRTPASHEHSSSLCSEVSNWRQTVKKARIWDIKYITGEENIPWRKHLPAIAFHE